MDRDKNAGGGSIDDILKELRRSREQTSFSKDVSKGDVSQILQDLGIENKDKVSQSKSGAENIKATAPKNADDVNNKSQDNPLQKINKAQSNKHEKAEKSDGGDKKAKEKTEAMAGKIEILHQDTKADKAKAEIIMPTDDEIKPKKEKSQQKQKELNSEKAEEFTLPIDISSVKAEKAAKSESINDKDKPKSGAEKKDSSSEEKTMFDDLVDDNFRRFFSETVAVDINEGDREARKVRKPIFVKKNKPIFEEENITEEVFKEEELEEEIDDYDSPNDAPSILADLKAHHAQLILRTWITGIIGVILIYLCLAQAIPALPNISAFKNGAEPLVFLIVNLVLVLIAILVNTGCIANGLAGLFSSPSADTMPALSAVAAAVQSVAYVAAAQYFADEKVTLFSGIAVLCLFANAFGKALSSGTIEKNFEIASAGFDHSAAYIIKNRELSRKVTSGIDEEQPAVLVSRQTALVKGFMKHSFSKRASDKTSQLTSRVLLTVSVLCGIYTAIASKNPITAISVFAAAMCLGAPLTSTLISAVPGVLMQRQTAKVGAVVPGWSAIEELGCTNIVMVGARDLFPPTTVRLHGIKTFEKERIDLAILYAASILIEGCDTLRDIFLSVIENKTSMLYKVENMVHEMGYGFEGWIENSRVLVGNREMMKRHSIEIPSMDYENRYTQGGKRPVYLAVSGKLFGMFLVSYRADDSAAAVVDDLRMNGISLLVQSDDFNVTADLIANVYGLPLTGVKMVGESENALLAENLAYLPESEGAMTHIGSFTSFIGGLRAAFSAAAAEKIAVIVQSAAIGLSVALIILLTITSGLVSLSLPAILLYQIAWLLLTICVPLTKKY